MPQEQSQRDHRMSGLSKCVELCQACSRNCWETIAHCLDLGGEHAEKEHITLLQVCAEICDTAIKALQLESKYYPQICDACAEICTATADDCEAFSDDEIMRSCATIARRCAMSCEEMSGATITPRSIQSGQDARSPA